MSLTSLYDGVGLGDKEKISGNLNPAKIGKKMLVIQCT